MKTQNIPLKTVKTTRPPRVAFDGVGIARQVIGGVIACTKESAIGGFIGFLGNLDRSNCTNNRDARNYANIAMIGQIVGTLLGDRPSGWAIWYASSALTMYNGLMVPEYPRYVTKEIPDTSQEPQA